MSIALVYVFASAISVSGQQAGDSFLYITKCKEGEAICDTQEVVRFSFADGRLVDRKLVFTSRTLDVRFDLSDSQIVDGKFLVSSSGDVIDLLNGELKYKSPGSLVSVRRNKILIDVDRVDDDDLYEFDLHSRTVKRFKSRDDLEELEYYSFSPNGDKFAIADRASGRIDFYGLDDQLSVKLIRSQRGKFYASCSIRCSGATTPVIWVSDTQVLTQEGNGRVVTLDLSGQLKRFPVVTEKEEPDSEPYFHKDEHGNYFYYYAGKEYLIDLARRNFSTDRFPLGSDFARSEPEFGTQYFFDGKSIGKFWSGEARSTSGYLGATFATKVSSQGIQPEGIKVWSSRTGEWLTLIEPWSVSLVGWVQTK